MSTAVFVSYKAMMLSLANIDETAEKWNAALVAAAKKILFVRDEDDEKCGDGRPAGQQARGGGFGRVIVVADR